jgi:FAD/FMN-containing dehydrogenase
MTDTLRASRLLDDLRNLVPGRVTGPDDEGYDAARAVMYGGIDGRPAAIVRVAGAPDVAAVVRYASEHDLPLTVRSGGHGLVGYAVADEAIVVDVRDLTAIDLDLEAGTVWAGSGLTAEALSAALSEHGRAVGFGDTGSVGLGGITLGGGIGYLVRKFGLTIDSLLAVELVTADGQIRRVDERQEPELFWAVRGAGTNFGVATRFKLALAAVPAFTGGLLVQPASTDNVTAFMAAADAAPDAVSTILNVMPCPPMPMIPEEHHGKLVMFSLMACAAPDDEAAQMLAPFRAIAEPLADLVQPMPYAQIYPPEDADYHPLAVARTLFIDRFDRPVIEGIIDTIERGEAPFRAVQLRVLGGASARVPNDATAYAHRDRRCLVNIAAFYEGPDDRAEREAWVVGFARDLAGGDRAGYVNFLVDEGDERIRAAYPHGAYERIAEIKRRYDPTNLFRYNQNIPPA